MLVIKKSNETYFLVPMRGTNLLAYIFTGVVIFLTFSSYIVPNPNEIVIPEFIASLNNIRVIVCVIISLWMLLRIRYIFHSKQPWIYGLEYSVYFFLIFCFFALASMFIAIILTITLFDSNFVYIYISLGSSFLSAISFNYYFIQRKKDGAVPPSKQKMKHAFIIPSIGSLVCIFMALIAGGSFIQTLGFMAFLIIPIVFSVALPGFLWNLYAWTYKININLGEKYEVLDGINPNKSYPPNFGGKKKKKNK